LGRRGRIVRSKLDLSFNRIRVIANLDALTQLRELYLISNKITAISGPPLPSAFHGVHAQYTDSGVRLLMAYCCAPRPQRAHAAADPRARIEPHPGAFGGVWPLPIMPTLTPRMGVQVIEHLDHLGASLEQLFLGRNKIERLQVCTSAHT
jgi:Leucine-rich repeat (LRR) protein